VLPYKNRVNNKVGYLQGARVKSYDYAHRDGVRPISWDEFVTLSGQLAEALDKEGVEVIVGIARAGLLPATLLSCMLRRELFPVRVTRRVNDEVHFAAPVWKVPVSPEVAGKVVAVVDEIADTGESLALVADAVRQQGASRVLTACLVRHSWANPAPTFSVITSDEFVIFPWDQRVYMQGKWQPHPEIMAGLAAQNKPDLEM
jgi:hypoxanthine phosphoribosyltransferase